MLSLPLQRYLQIPLSLRGIIELWQCHISDSDYLLSSTEISSADYEKLS
jgi:hypothetical protein